MTNITDIRNPDRKGLRDFGYVMAAAIVLLFGLFLPWAMDRPLHMWPWIVAAVFAGLGRFLPTSLDRVFRLWMRFGLAISKFTTPLILGIVFFLVITPYGIVMKIFSRDPLKRKLDPECESYRILSERPASDDMERPF